MEVCRYSLIIKCAVTTQHRETILILGLEFEFQLWQPCGKFDQSIKIIDFSFHKIEKSPKFQFGKFLHAIWAKLKVDPSSKRDTKRILHHEKTNYRQKTMLSSFWVSFAGKIWMVDCSATWLTFKPQQKTIQRSQHIWEKKTHVILSQDLSCFHYNFKS